MSTAAAITQAPAAYTVTPQAASRLDEKHSLQIINDRLSHYVQQVRRLREEAASANASALMESLNILDSEMKQLKDMYEHELGKVRKDAEGLSIEKNQYALEVTKAQSVASELETRLLQETDRSTKQEEEVRSLKRTLAAKDQQISHAQRAADGPLQEIRKLQQAYNDKVRDVERLQHRHDTEQLQRKEAEQRVLRLEQKLEFQIQLNHKDAAQMNERLQVATATIINLEQKVRELSQMDHNLEAMLSEVKARAEADLRTYQHESTELYSKNLTALRCQIDEDTRKIEQLTEENLGLTQKVADVTATQRALEGEIKSLQHQKQSLQESIVVEQNHSRSQIAVLQSKLRDLMDLLMMKMREVSAVRDAQLPLKAEIETLRRQLDEEERRMALPLLSTAASVAQDAAGRPGSQYGPAHLPTPGYTTTASTTAGAIGGPTVPTTPAGGSLQPPTPPGLVTQHHATDTIGGQDAISLASADDEFASLAHHIYPSTAPPAVGTTAPPVIGPIYGEKPYTGHLLGPVNEFIPGGQQKQEQNNKAGPTTPSPRDTRVKSAPAATGRASNLVPSNIGQGDDYFEKLFKDLKRTSPYLPHGTSGRMDDTGMFAVPDELPPMSKSSTPPATPDSFAPRPVAPSPPVQTPPVQPPDASTPACLMDRPVTAQSHDYTTCTSSYIGDINISEVHPEGKYIRIVNNNRTKDAEFGDYLLQQNVGGQPVAVYRFPPRLQFAANSVITIYSGDNDSLLHDPPRSFVFTEQPKWGTGPECTTILCKPSGQAIAWRTAAHRFTQDAYDNVSRNMAASPEVEAKLAQQGQSDMKEQELTELNADVTGLKGATPCLRREKTTRPCLSAQKHPHGLVPPNHSHPHTGQSRPKTYGNDNSSVNRQSRSQSARPDPIPGAPYAGAPAQRMGSALLMSYSPKNTLRSNGSIANKASAGELSRPPSSFQKPHKRFDTGLDQIMSQHNTDFNPPMPRPPMFSSW